MSMIFFYIPIYYTVFSRLRTLTKTISWVIIYLIPQFLFVFFVWGYIEFYRAIISIIFGVFLIYTLYEIGYIFNDTETIRKETNPTLRLNNEQIKYYYANKYLIYIVRVVIALVLSVFFIHDGQCYFVMLVWCIIPIFIIYNSIRNIWNLPLHFCLVFIRYCSVAFLLGVRGIPLLYCILLFPVINLLERCSEKRFQLSQFQEFTLSNKKDGRYKYYFILILMACALLFNSSNFQDLIFLLLSAYYFIYRWLTVKLKMA